MGVLLVTPNHILHESLIYMNDYDMNLCATASVRATLSSSSLSRSPKWRIVSTDTLSSSDKTACCQGKEQDSHCFIYVEI